MVDEITKKDDIIVLSLAQKKFETKLQNTTVTVNDTRDFSSSSIYN